MALATKVFLGAKITYDLFNRYFFYNNCLAWHIVVAIFGCCFRYSNGINDIHTRSDCAKDSVTPTFIGCGCVIKKVIVC